ncbi:MAG: hypothetical protein II990_09175 [Muribaculaceae bacterium]|nr:hypothetical protein [Muribaculaceae bacterium]
MKKLIFTLLISLFALNVVAQKENTNFRYEVSVSDYIGSYTYRVKLDTQTGRMWLLIYDKTRKQYSINTQVLPANNGQSKPGRYTFCPNSAGAPYGQIILDKVTGNVYHLLTSNTLNSWKLVPF